VTVETPLYRFLSAAIELTWLATLWLLASVPVVTVPAATTALFRLARTRSETRVGAGRFIAAMRADVGRTTVIGGCWLVAGVILVADFWAFAPVPGLARVVASGALISIVVVYLAATPYLFTALAESELTGGRIVRLALLATLGTPATAVRCLIVLAACATAVVVIWPLVFVVPAIGATVLSRLCRGPVTDAVKLAVG
jgi:uncharacterized membrane protein YesL